MQRNTTRPRSTSITPPAATLPPPRTIGQLRALLIASLAIVERKGRISALARRDCAAMLRAAIRYRMVRADG